MITLVLPVIRGSKGFGFLMTDKTSVRTMYLENSHSKKQRDQNILIKTSEVIVITGNCVMITHFEENKAKNWPKTNAYNAIYVWT